MAPHTVHDPQLFYAAIVARILGSTGKQVGLAIAPKVVTLPYSVVYPLPDERTEGGLNNPTQVVVWEWQVTCVSDSGAGAQWIQHKVRVALQGHIPVVTGVGTTPIELSNGSGVTRQDTPPPTLFYSTDRFTAYASV